MQNIFIAKEERIFLRGFIYRRATLKRMRQKRTDLAKILSRIRKLLSVSRARGKIKEQEREREREQRRAWKGTVSRLQDKEDDKDTVESVQTRLIIFVGRCATYDVYVSPRRDAPVRLIATGTPKTNYPAILLPFSRLEKFLRSLFPFLFLFSLKEIHSAVRCF